VWRPINGRSELRVAVWLQRLQAHLCGLSLQPIGCTPALSVTQSAAAAAVHGLWHYISVGPLRFCYSSDILGSAVPLLQKCVLISMAK